MNKNKFGIGVVLVFVFLFIAYPVYGTIEPPHKEIDYCYRIDNITNYPFFTIIARYPSVDWESFQNPIVTLSENECFSRRNRDEIAAVRTDLFLRPGTQATEYVDQWKGDEYFYTSENVLSSGIEAPVSPITVYDLDDPRKKIEDVFTIDALDDEQFVLRLAKRVTQFDDGTVRERDYATLEAGMADTIAPGYDYTYTPISKSEQEIPVLGSEAPTIYRSLDEVIARLFMVVFFILGTIAAIVLLWSALMWALKRDHRARYRRIALYSLLVFVVVIILEIIRYMVVDSMIRGLY